MNAGEQRNLLDAWYRSIKNQQFEEATAKKQEIEDHLKEMKDPEILKLYKSINIRYHLLCNEWDQASLLLAETGPEEDNYHWLNYYYHFFTGILHYERQEYAAAIEAYTKAKRFISTIDIEETAELFYKLASAYSRSYQVTRSIKYTNKALEIFQEKNNYRRIASCEILLGLNNHDIQQYKTAEEHYQHVFSYVERSNDKSLKMRVLHNMGLLYTEINKPETAIEYLSQVLELNHSFDPFLKCQNLYLLAKNHFLTNQVNKAKELLEQGLTYAKAHKYQSFEFQFKLLKTKFLEPSYFEQSYSESINYFNQNEIWQLVIEYSEELASYYREKEKHKDAIEYFKLAVDAKNKFKKECELSIV